MSRWRTPQLAEPQLFLVLALLIGVFSGLTVVCFRIAMEMAHVYLLGPALSPSPARLFLVLPLAGLAIAAFVELVSPAIRGSGVNQTKAAVYIYDGYIAFRTVAGKFVAATLAIGSGQSLGPEDPSLHMGAGIASAIGRGAGLSRQTLRLIAPVGAAAGLAAAFNSPVTAVLFVLEEVIGTWNAVALGAIVIAAIASVVVQHWFLGDQPLFRVPEYHQAQMGDLLVYAVLGLVGGILSLAFVKLALHLRRYLKARPRWTRWVQPAMAGLFIATVAVWFPQVAGAGYEHIDAAIHDQYVWQVLAALAVLKLLATAASFASGTPGGLFAPTLFIGAMAGGAVCGATRALVPGFEGDTGIYALVGMGTLFAGILRAPITSVFMILEVSGSYSIVLPVMISNTVAYVVSRQYQRDSIFDMVARQDGMELPSMEHRREAVIRRVEDAMRPPPVVLPRQIEVRDALRLAEESATRQMLAHIRPHAWVLASVADLEALAAEGKDRLAVGGVMALATPLPILHPDEPLDAALAAMGDSSLLPVVHRAEPSRLVGVVSLEDILQAYRSDRPPPPAV
ncbi:ClcB-like voltage-gated chloride channel protein [soil metagenome]|nr:chloride channel protein [Acidobacteriota bacterium]